MLGEQAARLKVLARKHGIKKEKKGKIIAISSGKGGVGKSNIAVNMGIGLSQMGKKVLVLDADLGQANINVLLGVIPRYNLYHVVKGYQDLANVVTQAPGGLHIIAGASGLAEMANLDDRKREMLLDELQRLEFEYDYIIIDTGAGIGRNVVGFITGSDETYIVTTPEPTALADAYGLIKVISSEVPEAKLKLIVNRVNSIIEGKKAAKKIIDVSAQFLNMKVEALGFVFEDPAVAKAVQLQKPLLLVFPKSRSALAIRDICFLLERVPIEKSKGGFFRMLRWFRGNV